MTEFSVILNEREARNAREMTSELDELLSSARTFEPIVAGLPPQVVDGFRNAIKAERGELEALVKAYEAAKAGDFEDLERRAENDPGLTLIVARIARGLTQKELARKLGLKEQQIQRYEADRYRSISLANFRRVARFLGVDWKMGLSNWFGGGWNIARDVSAAEVRKVLKHARTNGWFGDDDPEIVAEEESFNYLQRYVSDHILKYGSPSLLRTGMNVQDHSEDLLVLAWKARVTRRAEQIISAHAVAYRPLDITWLMELARLSQHGDGPARARDLLLSKGIVLVAEPQIPGMKVDGAAFLLESVPVIGLTLRRDTVDNFWFTLLHEVGHVILHYRTGLRTGFFDDTDTTDVDEIEEEANSFASNVLIPEERWKRSPARITKSPAVVEKFAKELGINPAIVFGRIQKERGNYAVFSNSIGRGAVRKHLIGPSKGS
ncbi:XRE family transcriptional regulator [Mesorhizobium sp. Cs1299R1N1]|uniref:XRE family transcriptional regulator n=1 Tax=unclassified Mesorhizobium TaxID=325217 RepID=UPI00301E1AC9